MVCHCRRIYPVYLPSINPVFHERPFLLPADRIVNNTFERTNSNVGRSSSSVRFPRIQVDKQKFKISYIIHVGFTTGEEIIIETALQTVADRLVKPEILQNMYQICGTSGYDLAPGVWQCSQLANNHNYNHPSDLLRYQLMCLRVNGEQGKFPTIHIYPIYEQSETLGRGTIGCVSCVSHGSMFSIKGEFDVKLNRYNLGAPGRDGSDPVLWGGVIVHEMLHNLGHDHNGKDYNSNWQINVFERCFKKYGKYSI